MNDSLLEACARAMFELVAKGNDKMTWLEFSGIIRNMNSGVFGNFHNMPTKKVEVQSLLREYIDERTKKQEYEACDVCECTPCDCHWGTI